MTIAISDANSKTVTLLRHLKSDWNDPSVADFDRPLNARGKNAGLLVASAIVARCPAPDLILCSPSRRTRDTLNYLLREFTIQNKPEPTVQFDARIYEASAQSLKARIAEVPDTIRNLLVIGHNPAMLDLAWSFSETPVRTLSLYRKYPTGSVATYALPIDHWADIYDVKGEALIRFTPKILKREYHGQEF